eukprot:TRINITY_DN17811_c0_g3_i2.p1 TRINITY_DN17811_c0_g3~~TRINITY_DN17811_c0_g3_i2.p1  ORF type:complete len:898 (+),score=69.44 TRINITY_DN17811_c0_g3_i2:194-2887(+)
MPPHVTTRNGWHYHSDVEADMKHKSSGNAWSYGGWHGRSYGSDASARRPYYSEGRSNGGWARSYRLRREHYNRDSWYRNGDYSERWNGHGQHEAVSSRASTQNQGGTGRMSTTPAEDDEAQDSSDTSARERADASARISDMLGCRRQPQHNQSSGPTPESSEHAGQVEIQDGESRSWDCQRDHQMPHQAAPATTQFSRETADDHMKSTWTNRGNQQYFMGQRTAPVAPQQADHFGDMRPEAWAQNGRGDRGQGVQHASRYHQFSTEAPASNMNGQYSRRDAQHPSAFSMNDTSCNMNGQYDRRECQNPSHYNMNGPTTCRMNGQYDRRDVHHPSARSMNDPSACSMHGQYRREEFPQAPRYTVNCQPTPCSMHGQYIPGGPRIDTIARPVASSFDPDANVMYGRGGPMPNHMEISMMDAPVPNLNLKYGPYPDQVASSQSGDDTSTCATSGENGQIGRSWNRAESAEDGNLGHMRNFEGMQAVNGAPYNVNSTARMVNMQAGRSNPCYNGLGQRPLDEKSEFIMNVGYTQIGRANTNGHGDKPMVSMNGQGGPFHQQQHGRQACNMNAGCNMPCAGRSEIPMINLSGCVRKAQYGRPAQPSQSPVNHDPGMCDVELKPTPSADCLELSIERSLEGGPKTLSPEGVAEAVRYFQTRLLLEEFRPKQARADDELVADCTTQFALMVASWHIGSPDFYLACQDFSKNWAPRNGETSKHSPRCRPLSVGKLTNYLAHLLCKSSADADCSPEVVATACRFGIKASDIRITCDSVFRACLEWTGVNWNCQGAADPCPWPVPDGMDGLECCWAELAAASNHERIYLNAPWSRVDAWIQKATREVQKGPQVLAIVPLWLMPSCQSLLDNVSFTVKRKVLWDAEFEHPVSHQKVPPLDVMLVWMFV